MLDGLRDVEQEYPSRACELISRLLRAHRGEQKIGGQDKLAVGIDLPPEIPQFVTRQVAGTGRARSVKSEAKTIVTE